MPLCQEKVLKMHQGAHKCQFSLHGDLLHRYQNSFFFFKYHAKKQTIMSSIDISKLYRNRKNPQHLPVSGIIQSLMLLLLQHLCRIHKNLVMCCFFFKRCLGASNVVLKYHTPLAIMWVNYKTAVRETSKCSKISNTRKERTP